MGLHGFSAFTGFYTLSIIKDCCERVAVVWGALVPYREIQRIWPLGRFRQVYGTTTPI